MKWLALLAALPVLLAVGALIVNRPPLFTVPGPLSRLNVYFTANVAQTRPDHPFPELRPPRLPASVEESRAAVAAAMRELGWDEVRAEEGEILAVVISPLFRFRDDVRVSLEGAAGGTLLHARSASRVGRGDLAANARHLRDLFGAVGRALEGRNADARRAGVGG